MSETFASRLKSHLDSKNIQQKSIAATLKVSPAVFSAWMKCKSEPSLDMLANICKELNISSDYLIGLTDTISAPAKSKEKKLPTNGVLNTKRPRNPLDGLTEEQIRHVTTLINSFIAENEALIQADLASKQEA